MTSRYARLVPAPFRKLRKDHRLARPNQWLGSAERTVSRNDDVFAAQVREAADQLRDGTSVETSDGREPSSTPRTAAPAAG